MPASRETQKVEAIEKCIASWRRLNGGASEASVFLLLQDIQGILDGTIKP